MLPEMVSDEVFKVQTIDVPNHVRKILERYLDFSESSFVDFGCDLGLKTYGYARHLGFRQILGIDINDRFKLISEVQQICKESIELPGNLNFMQIAPGDAISTHGPFDGFISWSVFEHVGKKILSRVLRDLFQALRPGAVSLIQVNPLYYSPYGHHLNHLFEKPWDHLLIEDGKIEEVIGERAHEKGIAIGGAMHVFSSLNRLKLGEFLIMLLDAGFSILHISTARTQMAPPPKLLARFDLDDLQIQGFQMIIKRDDT